MYPGRRVLLRARLFTESSRSALKKEVPKRCMPIFHNDDMKNLDKVLRVSQSNTSLTIVSNSMPCDKSKSLYYELN